MWLHSQQRLHLAALQDPSVETQGCSTHGARPLAGAALCGVATAGATSLAKHRHRIWTPTVAGQARMLALAVNTLAPELVTAEV